MKFPLRIFLISLFFIILSCSTDPNGFTFSTEPDDEPVEAKLFIMNGYYKKIEIAEKKYEYTVEFDYGVTGRNCSVGGYSIKWDENRRSSVIWYFSRKLEADRIYSINDTFKKNFDTTGNPLVQMQCYFEGCNGNDPCLRVEYYLEKKSS